MSMTRSIIANWSEIVVWVIISAGTFALGFGVVGGFHG